MQRLGALFVAAFIVLGLRQAWLAIVLRPTLALESYNPRSHDNPGELGPILARDSSPLAQSLGGKRTYALGPELAQTVGYASRRYGASGLESYYLKDLTASTTELSLQQRLRELFAYSASTAALRRGRVITTIDPVLQHVLFAGLRAHDHAAGIVLDPRNGDVLAMASVPSFDPSLVDSSFATLSRDPESSLLNRAVNGLYPPGSTFKIVTAATALEAGTANLETVFADPGYLQIGNYRVHNDENEITGRQTLAGAFMLSSNVDFARLGLDLGADKFYAGMRAFGVGEPEKNFPLEIALDRISPQNEIGDQTLAQYAFGQGDMLVTPLRMALITAAIAGGGVMPAPRLVQAVVDADGATRQIAPSVLARPVSAQTANNVRDLMIDVVRRGTGTAAALDDIVVAGKTGTATNPHGAAHSWFVAFAPAQSPRVVVAVIVENGGYGGAVAAPIVRRVMQTALAETERAK